MLGFPQKQDNYIKSGGEQALKKKNMWEGGWEPQSRAITKGEMVNKKKGGDL